ncbi:alpha-D-ribose 1-methylphosphonate 5-triphosphate diphosphatase [Roseobacter sp. HKCCD9010]|uniref:alpha-D-ribose 1-methylphosphonate 5-triphosphate diphosphatase n=1 Tax=unclassified Roseobacter TaxID=196798 RepID=UPI001490FAF2|nr:MULTISPECIES: alpha-D-ribose 1-methylphosphonate 5-triphosphate diphosphatase [unclassified Roseobacter]MBF9051507.1 alpha-D-ribose 1-methylphosphonate 5-triphosphate diphosphatase [Rhodobacterales bacterium HKCCD4356]NNV13031.1 alpha-D-ribose 1-methylphosphonate 5-triphosphate diphosphatase [Roseobacter sp. HKCCD7357]NNV17282.1 alpha-D-ribose 1-methylphosphonate 5-triphosphate diphosphatase [Roseobacter sp. HKCCD8768]NNV26888.1 alpha-D-ribose 1-methylphosphonate 5-triphosphate diphosphatase
MPDAVILANATLVLPEETLTGHLRFENGEITDVVAGSAVPKGAVDCGGDIVAPGLIELHTDNLERHLRPRPRVDWPHNAAIVAHDAELAATGITTVFDAIRVGSLEGSISTGWTRYARKMADEILAMRTAGALKISHHLHLRAEICSHSLIEELDGFGPDDRVGILSLMDHTPGQRQFADLTQYEAYMRGKHGISQEAFEAHVIERTALGARVRAPHEAAAVEAAQRYGAVLASHDDTTVDHVAVSAAHGIRLAEFPTTMEAARACRQNAIAVMMGAPNLIRGGSHSGNVAAETLAEAGLLDILSSDYVPAALLYAAMKLGTLWGDMSRAMATVTSAPAKAAGLMDRGMIAPGKRADLIRFAQVGDVPVLHGVWSNGTRVA